MGQKSSLRGQKFGAKDARGDGRPRQEQRERSPGLSVPAGGPLARRHRQARPEGKGPLPCPAMAIAGVPAQRRPFRPGAAVAAAGLLAGLVVTVPTTTEAATTASSVLSAGCGIPVPGAPATPAAVTAPVGPGPVQLPKDEAAHGSAVEWWYFNGHLQGTGPFRAGALLWLRVRDFPNPGPDPSARLRR